MNIIRNRIERALAVSSQDAVRTQGRNGGRRRGSYDRSVVALPHHIAVRLGDDLHRELSDLCGHLNVERGVVIRDALAFYLGIAKQEGFDARPVATVTKDSDNA